MHIRTDPPLLLFDGDCGFCQASARWISRRWTHPTRPARAVAWQTIGADGLRELGLSETEVRAAAYWIDDGGRVSRGHRAVAQALLAGGVSLRILGAALLVPPVSWLARPSYWAAARYRYRLPGSTPACRADPEPSSRSIS